MQRTLIIDALNAEKAQNAITICGWVRTRRDAKGFSFVEINDGSCLANMQCIVDEGTEAHAALGEANTGAALAVVGELVPSPGKGQTWEVRAKSVTVFGLADPEAFPLQKKRHSDEFLRGIAHLRARTNKYGAAFRIRSEAGRAVHDFFHGRRFAWVHTPVLTGSDCEGAGEMFRVTTLAPGEKNTDGDFFNRPCNLTVSGQLEAEALALGLGRVYTFGPTFRAENSNTPRHAAEFWMIEPEMAFADLSDLMELGESLTRHVIEHVLAHCEADVKLFDNFVDKGLLERLQGMLRQPFARVPYAEAIRILEDSGKEFAFPVTFGVDLQTEHERYLAEEHFQRPVIVYDYPKEIKAFYMRANDDNETVAAMDMLVPRIGELIGGSQREERLDRLEARIRELGQNPEDYWWYLDLRRFGSVPHAGFGLGFERLLMLLTGITNIRDVIPFPRTPGNLEF
ncbi:asparagine--tRNA ligase [Desulfovibrio fairfieldensis]|uniref:Asparagine--tRNA ligase n=1 Tax=Desulfovibrio fairfieldensis TaxID=44742 RepID=A0A0X8JM59_9BACT|nr:asparagine--tRNA ligase [Desulfovibrio fairfieldensis]AMD91283.1 asparagine--tRNA ligase [Desulfovibrio fairfieldensis]GKG93705.1 asparagine--tRNA ligase [Desulfovibrionaceae bacterium]GKI12257.1 asparagine--tRNA ligase [Desulfovibrionaceae bacterium]